MHILWHSLTTLGDEWSEYRSMLQAHLDAAAREDTTFELRSVTYGTGDVYQSFEAIGEAEVVRNLLTVRDRDDVDAVAVGNTFDPGVQQAREILDRIDEHCDDVLVNVTSAGSSMFERAQRLRPILETDPGPEIATIDMGPLNAGDDGTATHTRDEIESFARAMREAGVKPELELFHGGQFTELFHLLDEGLLEEPYLCNLVFGLNTGTVRRPRNLLHLVENLLGGGGVIWTCTATGRHQLPLTTMGIVMGGHVRVGMEDNVYYRKGELAESNAQLVERTVRLADELERSVATPAETRDLLDL